MAVCTTLASLGQLTEQSFRQGVAGIQPPLGTSVLHFLSSRPWRELEAAIQQIMAILAGGRPPLKDEEFESLTHAATHGAPPVAAPQVGAPPHFEVPLSEVVRVPGPSNRITFRVAPVTRLRMVLVQTAYQRMDPAAAQLVPVDFSWAEQRWYPGVELFGEGIFIDLADHAFAPAGSRSNSWTTSYAQSNPPDATLHPLHVWWHTLSHRLLRALSIDSGYSAASIRERVYVRIDAQRRARGGLLLYTAQPGGDGTLGGLIALVPSFSRVLGAALRDLASCSNDPLCEETVPNGVNGSACYSCLLASETSCDQRNVHLDRGLLLQNAP